MNIRKITTHDAQAMLALNIKLDAESDFMLFDAGERDPCMLSQAQLIKESISNSYLIWLVAEDDDSSIHGYCAVSAKPQLRVKHVGSLVVGVAKDYWHQGIGFDLVSAAIEQSKILGYSRLELTVRSDNFRAIALYQKLGFKKEGLRKNSIQINGNYFDEFYMAKT